MALFGLWLRTKRPVVITVNGQADAVLMDTQTYEKHLRASNMMRLLVRPRKTLPPDVHGPCARFCKNSNMPTIFRVSITRADASMFKAVE